MAITPLRGEELLRFLEAVKRKQINRDPFSAYEILARSGYEKREEKDVEYLSSTSYAVENFISRYCEALIDKYGVPELLEDPFTPPQDKRFAREATPPSALLDAVPKVKSTMSAFRAGYISYKDNEANVLIDQYSNACEKAKQKRRREDRERQENRISKRVEQAQKAIKDELDARAKEYREKGARPRPRVPGTQPSPKSRGIDREILTGKELILHCIKLANQGIPETSICIRAGYSTDSIGVFRRSFSKAGAVKFGPLAVMLRDFAKTHKDAPKILTELETPRSATAEITPEALPKFKATQAITEEKNLVTVTTKQRERDASFRNAILKIHGEKCVCCDLAIKDLLEAAHIVPVAFSGSDIVENGLPLCPTHHVAFDRNLFTFDPVKKTILLKEGLAAADLGITKNFLELNVSQEALRIRLGLFSQS